MIEKKYLNNPMVIEDLNRIEGPLPMQGIFESGMEGFDVEIVMSRSASFHGIMLIADVVRNYYDDDRIYMTFE